MASSGDGTPSGPRASDADRDRFAKRLHEEYAEGRLSLEELQRRIDAVYAAQTLIELYELTSDLPYAGPAGLSTRSSGRSSSRGRRRWWPFG